MNKPGNVKRKARKKGRAMVMNFDVAVRAKGPASKGVVECSVSARGKTKRSVIFLDYDQEYNITFALLPGHGVNAWSNAPFGNQEGACPPAGQGPTGRFSLRPSANAGSIIVHVDPIPSRPEQRVEKYRLNFNGGVTCDPIIIVG